MHIMTDRPRPKRNWFALVTLVPMAASVAVYFPRIVSWAEESPVLAAFFGVLAAGLIARFIVLRLLLRASIRRRLVRSRPTGRCRVCGYTSDGLETIRQTSGTLPFDQTLCPECGRPNPR